MNREQKIALIIGFAVILVVGVLVSDHWSRARQVDLADASEGDAGLVQGPPIAALPSPGEMREAPSLADSGQDPIPAEVSPPADLPGFVAIDQGSGASDSPLGRAFGAAESEEGASPGRGDTLLDHFQRVGERLAQSIDTELPAAASVGAERSAAPPVTGSGQRDATAAPAEAAKPVRHTVAKNESLFAIAKRYYGDGSKWRRIAEANPKKVSKDGQVQQGVTLDIPGADSNAQPASQPEDRKASPQPPSRPTTYTVRPNDSLSEIAQKLLGSSRRTGEILAANRGKIRDPDDIRIGMVLTIPSNP